MTCLHYARRASLLFYSLYFKLEAYTPTYCKPGDALYNASKITHQQNSPDQQQSSKICGQSRIKRYLNFVVAEKFQRNKLREKLENLGEKNKCCLRVFSTCKTLPINLIFIPL